MSNRAAPSIPQSADVPAKTALDLDTAVEQLFRSIQLGFDRASVLRLGCRGEINIARAETELRLLDLSAVYFAIKTTHCDRWKRVGAALFERVCTKVLIWWAPAWDTKDDVVEVLNGRFAAYNRLTEASGPADLNDMSMLVGLLCAATIQGDRSVFANNAEKAGEALPDVLVDLFRGENPLATTAATVFRTRFTAVSEFLTLRH